MRSLLAVGLVLVSGCVSSLPDAPVFSSVSPGAPRVVVGIVDSGINPYHEIYRDAAATVPADFVDTRTGLPPVPVRLSAEGSFEYRVQKDWETWRGLEGDKLYWFEGTRVLGLSLPATRAEPRVLDDFHGHAVASTVRSVAPEAWIVMVQISDPSDSDGLGVEEVLASYAVGISWLAVQPWVDLVSLSLGLPSDPPLFWETFNYVDATKMAVEQGKLVLNAAGNFPTPTVLGGTAGPPWVITVGGGEASTHGEKALDAKVVDVVSEHTRRAAGRQPEEYRMLSGTSIATPVVAGVLAQALKALRVDAQYVGGAANGVLCPCFGGVLSASDLRGALNTSAVYWNLADYKPLNYSAHGMPADLFGPTLPVGPAPWVQMGWGYVGNTTWPVLVELLKGEVLLERSSEAREYMARQQALREAYWSVSRG